MSDPVSGWGIWHVLKTGWGYVRSVWTRGKRIIELEARVEQLEKGASAKHRVCPKCQERDFRPQAQNREMLDVYTGDSVLHKHWLCYSCGHTEDQQIHVPG